MSGDIAAEASSRLPGTPGWQAFLDLVERTAGSLGADGVSVGVAERDRIFTFNTGFLERTSTRFASIAVSTALPGPHAYRTGAPLFFTNARDSLIRFPMTVAIADGHPYQAAACLPLTSSASRRLGYLALHYVVSREFHAAEQQRLDSAGSAISTSLLELLRAATPLAPPGDASMSTDELRVELAGLRTAMENRAIIEQAKGKLMERYAIDATQAWRLLTRWSSEHNRKVRDVALDVVDGYDLKRADLKADGDARAPDHDER